MCFRPLRGLYISKLEGVSTVEAESKGFRPLRGLYISKLATVTGFSGDQYTGFRPLRGLYISK